MKVILATAGLIFAANVCQAQSLSSMQKATELGSILASEKMCGLAYDQGAIADWIDKNVDPSDMGFASNLSLMTEGANYQFEGMSESAKTAHCRSVERTAKHFGFLKD